MQRGRLIRRLIVSVLTVGVVIALGLWFVTRTVVDDLPDTQGDLATHHARLGGLDRTWSTYTPEGLAGEDVPIVVVLHGSTQDGDAMRRTTGHRFEELADEHGFVVAYPDAFGNWNECRREGEWEAKERGVDDVAFMSHLVRNTPRVDPDRVFVTGFSSGGQMAIRLALEAPDLVAAIAPVAANLPVAANSTCADSGEPVPALFVEGTDDPMNPYEGGDVALWGIFGNRGEVLSATDSLDSWRDRGTTEPDSRLRTIEGGGHQYHAPGVRGPLFLGPTDDSVDVPLIAWDHFDTVARTD